MSKHKKILEQILRGASDANLSFEDLCNTLLRLDFQRRIKGGHSIFWREGIPEIINLQPLSNGRAKPYQVRQVRGLILKYKLGGAFDEV